MPVERRSGIIPEDAEESFRSDGKGKGVVQMQPAKMSPVRQGLELVTEEHCSCCRDALASAAHELKTPLAIMGGYLHLLLTEKLGPLSARQVEVLTEMQANSARLTNFIQNLLTYATLKVDRFEMQYEVGDINACIREIAEVWAQRFQDKAIAFYFLPNEKLPAVPVRLLQGSAHGLQSARQRHEVHAVVGHGVAARGALFLGAANGFSGTPLVERRKERMVAPNCCRISVADTGPGIAPEFQQEIFEEYFRLTPQGTRAEGYGLGLGDRPPPGAGRRRQNLGGKRTRSGQQIFFPRSC